jgi:secondary thiamine-phosphate synthase enzyme
MQISNLSSQDLVALNAFILNQQSEIINDKYSSTPKALEMQYVQPLVYRQRRRDGVVMKNYRKELWFEVPSRRAFINITPQVEQCLRESGIREGLVLVNAMHITASVFINDDEAGLHHDYDVWLEKLAPHEPVSQYRHNVGEDNADAHMKRQIMGREVVVAVTEGKLDFGTWERIFYGEFDGRRRKRALVKIIGE